MRLNHDLLRNSIILTCGLALIPIASTLASDRDLPIRIVADSAVRDEVTGETRYEGHVSLTQGGLSINAHSLMLKEQSDGKAVLIATGNPAILNKDAEAGEPSTFAYANRIEYMDAERRVRLDGDATIIQEDAIISSETIDYQVDTSRVIAAGGPEEGKLKQRVEVVLPPSALRESR
jgi:lipopolysaccharide export system protein LptA